MSPHGGPVAGSEGDLISEKKPRRVNGGFMPNDEQMGRIPAFEERLCREKTRGVHVTHGFLCRLVSEAP